MGFANPAAVAPQPANPSLSGSSPACPDITKMDQAAVESTEDFGPSWARQWEAHRPEKPGFAGSQRQLDW
jgi:hypothetical protein